VPVRAAAARHDARQPQQFLPVYASAKDKFFYKVVDAQFEFQRDAAGAITGLTFHQGGATLNAKRK
jgi:hypothetical protein